MLNTFTLFFRYIYLFDFRIHTLNARPGNTCILTRLGGLKLFKNAFNGRNSLGRVRSVRLDTIRYTLCVYMRCTVPQMYYSVLVPRQRSKVINFTFNG